VFCDESHVSVPQIGAMYKGDYRRKFTWPNMASACPAASTTVR
jgi:excinuclease UvrABC helicase subunit UvrB